MNLFLIKEWLKYFHLCTDEHSLHSPYFYHFYQNLLKSKHSSDTDLDDIELKRSQLLKSDKIIQVEDFGAGSQVMRSNKRRVSDVARHSLSSKKFSAFLFRLIQHFQFKEIIELGTCLGINTAYLAEANKEASVHTFEGDKSLLQIAKNVLEHQKNIQFLQGNIDQTLSELLLNRTKPIDLVYIDANHTYEATINYFEELLPYHHSQSIFIFDDIHWSKDMKRAWNKIKEHQAVTSSIDIFDAGILFFNPDFQKQHFILNF